MGFLLLVSGCLEAWIRKWELFDCDGCSPPGEEIRASVLTPSCQQQLLTGRHLLASLPSLAGKGDTDTAWATLVLPR